jgi:hypothetical protein
MKLPLHTPLSVMAAIVMIVCGVYSQSMYISWVWKNRRTNRQRISGWDYLAYLRQDDPGRARIWLTCQMICIASGLFLLLSMFMKY